MSGAYERLLNSINDSARVSFSYNFGNSYTQPSYNYSGSSGFYNNCTNNNNYYSGSNSFINELNVGSNFPVRIINHSSYSGYSSSMSGQTNQTNSNNSNNSAQPSQINTNTSTNTENNTNTSTNTENNTKAKVQFKPVQLSRISPKLRKEAEKLGDKNILADIEAGDKAHKEGDWRTEGTFHAAAIEALKGAGIAFYDYENNYAYAWNNLVKHNPSCFGVGSPYPDVPKNLQEFLDLPIGVIKKCNSDVHLKKQFSHYYKTLTEDPT